VFYHLYTDGIDGTLTHRAGFRVPGQSIPVKSHHYNPMCLLEVSASSYRMNFCMEELFVRQTNLARMMILQRVRLEVAVLAYRKNFPTAVVDDRGDIEPTLGHDQTLLKDR
jgi:hypothetical protein